MRKTLQGSLGRWSLIQMRICHDWDPGNVFWCRYVSLRLLSTWEPEKHRTAVARTTPWTLRWFPWCVNLWRIRCWSMLKSNFSNSSSSVENAIWGRFFLNLFNLFVCLLCQLTSVCVEGVEQEHLFRDSNQAGRAAGAAVVFTIGSWICHGSAMEPLCEPLGLCEAQATARPGSVCPTGFGSFSLGREQTFQWAKNRCKWCTLYVKHFHKTNVDNMLICQLLLVILLVM